MTHLYVQRPAEKADDVVGHHVGLIMEAVEIFERHAREMTDEEQQDFQLTLRITSPGGDNCDITYRWMPGYQRASLISGPLGRLGLD